jgi:RraA family protein
MNNTGFRVFTEIKRPDSALVNKFTGLPVANIADCMNRSGVMASRIRKMGKNNLLGVAFTVKTRAGDNLMVHKALQMAQPGDVLIIDAHGDVTNAIMGELMIRTAEQKQLAGVIIDGAVRDIAVLSTLEIPVYAAGVTAAGPFKDGPGEINVPVSVGGIAVNPGDIIVSDDDGIVVISAGDAEEIYENAKIKNDKEADIIKLIMSGTRDYSWIDNSLKSKNCEIIHSTFDGK